MQPCLLPERPAPSQFRDLSSYSTSTGMRPDQHGRIIGTHTSLQRMGRLCQFSTTILAAGYLLSPIFEVKLAEVMESAIDGRRRHTNDVLVYIANLIMRYIESSTESRMARFCHESFANSAVLSL